MNAPLDGISARALVGPHAFPGRFWRSGYEVRRCPSRAMRERAVAGLSALLLIYCMRDALIVSPPLESSTERIRDRLRRTNRPRQRTDRGKRVYTENRERPS